MPIFTAVAAAVSAAVGGGIFGAVAGFAARTLLTVGITKLIGNRTNSSASGTQDAGSRIQLPPATNNKVPVVYGKAYMAPIITDAKISEDQKTMWYVCTLAEVTDTGSYTFGDMYWGGKKMVFDGTDTSKVVALETNSDPVQVDDKVNDKIHVYRFPNGSASGIDTGGTNAITLLSDTSIPADLRWNSALYTSGGQSASMTDLAFLIVKVSYDTNAGTTNLATMNVELTNSLTKPNEVLYDYMTNDRYGCAILPADVDTASLDVLGDYSDELITYVPVGGGTATQARYRINGPINTGQNCLSNLQSLVDACDSWLQYSELSGSWTIVVNKPYDWDGTVITDLFLIDNSNLISGINVNPIDLNSSYNILEVQYPNTNINDQTDYNIINLIDYVPEVMSYNEPPNQLTVQYPVVNDYIQSTYLGIRRLLQSREDLTIDCTLDYSGIQIQAGDVIRVIFEPYGWDGVEFPDGKLFRVSQVQEAKLDDGSLGARITAFEYNGTVYYDDPINDFVPASNTGLTDPNIFSSPGTPTVATNPLTDGNVKSFKVTSTSSLTGSVLYMDFNYGTSNNVTTHKLYKTVSKGDGTPYTASTSVNIDVTDLPPATYYWSVTARNDQAGRSSASSSGFGWAGPNVTTYDPITNTGGISWSNMSKNAAGSLIITNYSVPNDYVTVLPPVSVTSTTQRNIPLIYPGTSVASTDIFPYAQGTAVDTYPPQGYTVNSTAPWYPAGAAVEYITHSADGFDGWRKIISCDLSSITWTTQEVLVSQSQFALYTDTANTTIQLVPYARFSNQSAYDVLQTHFMTTFLIQLVFPYTFGATPVYNGPAVSEVIEVGYYIRNVTVGSNVTCYSATMSTRQAYPYTGSIL